MPLSRTAFVRATIAFIFLGLAALLAIVGGTFWLVGQTQTYSDRVAKARQQRAAIVDLRGLTQDAETGQRGYLLGGNEDYLEPYLNAERELSGQMARVRSLTARDPEVKGAIDRLSVVLADKMAELKRTIDIDRAGQHDAAIAIVKTNLGHNLMEEARDVFDRLISLSDSQITNSMAEQQLSISNLRSVTLASVLAILLVASGSAWTVLLYTRQLVEAQNEVSALNAGLEERVRERTLDLGRANDEIQRFAYIVTHDLRAPLVNIMGFTSELEAGLAEIRAYIEQPDGAADGPAAKEARRAVSDDMPEAIGFIRASSGKMDGLINAILKLSREGRRTLRPERIELAPLLQTAAANIHHQAVEIGGEIAIEAGIRPIVSDRLALEQIFGNLLDNAVKYSQAGRPLNVRVRAREERGGRVLIDVEDNGRGIASQDHERVFDLFRRSGPQDQRGEGIGLAHVRVIVRTLGGEITLKSEFGRGTTFTVSLPRDVRNIIGAA